MIRVVQLHVFVVVMLLGLHRPLFAQTSVFSCSTFASTGSCGLGNDQSFHPNGVVSLSSPNVTFIPTGAVHRVGSLWWSSPVNIQKFTSTFTFVPNGQNFAFVVQNDVGSSGNGTGFDAGAGCESGFYQAFGNGPFPNNLLALELDSYSPLTLNGSFSYSSAQIYQANQSPCLPNDDGPDYTPTTKLSTYPVNLTSGAQDTTTGDRYSATVTYDGAILALNMYDLSKGGSCPGSACYSHTWTTNIPSLVGNTTAYVGFTAATGLVSLFPLYLDSFSFTEGATTQASSPTFTPAAGTYNATQLVNLSDASSGATVYYTTDGTTPTTGSSKYSGPITVGSSETLQAMAVETGASNSAVASATYTIASSSPSGTSASTINFPSGFAAHPGNLWLSNGAIYSGSSIEMTQANTSLANNLWYKYPVNVQAFNTQFEWTANCPAKPARCGDGLGFMIISRSNPSSLGYNYSGSSGSQFSWSRCSSQLQCPYMSSVLVKFDLYNNSTGSDGANLTGFYSAGSYPQPPQAGYDMSPSGISMQSGHLMKATLTYNGSVLMETVTDTVTGATYRNSYAADIPSMVAGDTAFVGFGGSSGAAYVTQMLQGWTYTVEAPAN